MRLYDLLAAANLSDNICFNDREISTIEVNTNNVKRENATETIFVCIKGAKYDTHKDIPYLATIGVPIIIADKKDKSFSNLNGTVILNCKNTRKTLALISRAFFNKPDEKMKIVGITGTKGKTTVTYMLSEICRYENKKCGIIGTNGAFFDGKQIECVNSTPGSPEFYGILRQMADCGVEYVFCEVTSQALLQHRVDGTHFNLAVFTNLFPDHIGKDEHQSFEEYRECKSRLFEMCDEALLNGDDSQCDFFVSKCEKLSVPYNCYYPSNCCDKIRTAVKMPGAYNVANALCACTIAEKLGYSWNNILKGIENVKVTGRCETVENPCGIRVVIDYAHNKESLENVLKALREECLGKLICVFGAGGDRSVLRRSGMGKAASEFADFSVVTSDNPRNEEPEKIIADILEGMKGKEKSFNVIRDRRQAIFYALSMAKPGDTVLLAGKGAQLYEEIKGVKYKLDEREVVAEYFRNITQQ